MWTYGILESKFKRIYNAINDALKLTCAPNKLSTSISQRPIWWNKSVSKARAKVRLLTKKKKKDPIFGPDLALARKDYKLVILAAKQKSWEVFTTQTDSTSKISKLIRSLNSSRSECLGLLKDPTTGEFLDDPLASTNVLLEKFFQKHDKMSFPEFLQTGGDTCLW